MKTINLSGKNGEGKVMLIDDQDYDRFIQHKWYIHQGYALTVKHISGSHTKDSIIQKNLVAHRYVFELEKGDGVVIDHKNGNKLDNRRENLRLTGYKENSWNSKRLPNAAGYIGVQKQSENSFHSMASGMSLGYYKTARIAALAYDKFIREQRGEFAVFNFPEITDYSDVIRSKPHNPHERSSKITGVSYSHTRRAKEKWRVVLGKCFHYTCTG